MARGLENWLVQLGQRVISSTDSEQEKLNKTLAIFASGLMGFGAMLWLASTLGSSALWIGAVTLVLTRAVALHRAEGWARG